jgi:aquacobalamin reductase/NAD(P)H-flavin reductase
MNTVNCHVHAVSSLTANVYKVLLKADKNFDFIPGQYLNLVMSDDDKRPFSIASAPNAEFIELQIGAFGADSYAMKIIQRIIEAQVSNETVTVEMPLGGAGLVKESKRPLLLLAGGTGFSYIKSMFEYLAETQSEREVIVYWGLREQSACYELEKTAATLAKLTKATFIPVIGATDNSADVKSISEQMIEKYVPMVREAFEEIKPHYENLKEFEDVLINAKLYIDDAENFLKEGKKEYAVLSIGYADGLVDALRIAKGFDPKM